MNASTPQYVKARTVSAKTFAHQVRTSMQSVMFYLTRAADYLSTAPPTCLYIENGNGLTNILITSQLLKKKKKQNKKKKNEKRNEIVTLLTHRQDKRSQYKYASS